MSDNPLLGAGYVLRGLRLITQPGLRRFVLVPFLINTVLFATLGWYAYRQLDTFIDWLLPPWLEWLSWLLWPLFGLAGLLIAFYTFTVMANLIAAPFNGILAEKVESHLSGSDARVSGSASKLLRELVSALLGELRKLGHLALRAVPLLLLFVIPGANLVAPVLWILFSAWALALEYADYPMGNHSLTFPEQIKRLRERRMTALGFGGGVLLLTVIPVLNFVAVPAAVAAATIMWVEQLRPSASPTADTEHGSSADAPEDSAARG
jgi:CysZ protein